MPRRPSFHDFAGFIRFHEHALVRALVIGLVLVSGIGGISAMVDGIRIPVLDRVEQILNYWDDRWSRRVEYGERLMNAKAYEQAAEYLGALDRMFPARSARHKRDGERERLLRALGRSYAEMGKKRLALDTYQRLVKFDPRNFENHHFLVQACLRFGETELAERHLAEILKIHPTHMPSVRAYLSSHFAKGEFAAVVAAYESYLNAFLMQQVMVALGQSSTSVYLPVDGRFHDVDLRLSHLPKTAGELVLQPGQFTIEIKRITIQSPLLVGVPGATTTPLWPGEILWRVQEIAPIGAGSFRALGPGADLRLDVPPQPRGITEVNLRLRLFKPVDPDLWSMVEKSYKNLLKYDELKAARDRSVAGISNGAGL